jgi:hypothetical protein
MPIILDNSLATQITIPQTSGVLLEVSGDAPITSNNLTIDYIANVIKAPTATGTLVYSVGLYINGSDVATTSSGVYKQSLQAGSAYSVISLKDFYNTIQMLAPIYDYKVKITGYTYGTVSKIYLTNQRLHVELPNEISN